MTFYAPRRYTRPGLNASGGCLVARDRIGSLKRRAPLSAAGGERVVASFGVSWALRGTVGLAPRVDSRSFDPCLLRPFYVTDIALLTQQIASIAQRSFFGAVLSRNGFPVELAIEIMHHPIHGTPQRH